MWWWGGNLENGNGYRVEKTSYFEIKHGISLVKMIIVLLLCQHDIIFTIFYSYIQIKINPLLFIESSLKCMLGK